MRIIEEKYHDAATHAFEDLKTKQRADGSRKILLLSAIFDGFN